MRVQGPWFRVQGGHALAVGGMNVVGADLLGVYGSHSGHPKRDCVARLLSLRVKGLGQTCLATRSYMMMLPATATLKLG